MPNLQRLMFYKSPGEACKLGRLISELALMTVARLVRKVPWKLSFQHELKRRGNWNVVLFKRAKKSLWNKTNGTKGCVFIKHHDIEGCFQN